METLCSGDRQIRMYRATDKLSPTRA